MNLQELLDLKRHNKSTSFKEVGRNLKFDTKKELIDFIILYEIDKDNMRQGYLHKDAREHISERKAVKLLGTDFVSEYIDFIDDGTLVSIILEKKDLLKTFLVEKKVRDNTYEKGMIHDSNFDFYMSYLIQSIRTNLYYIYTYDRRTSIMTYRYKDVLTDFNIFKGLLEHFPVNSLIESLAATTLLEDFDSYRCCIDNMKEKEFCNPYLEIINFFEKNIFNLRDLESEYCFESITKDKVSNKHFRKKVFEHSLTRQDLQSEILEEKLRSAYDLNKRYSFCFGERAPYLEYLGFKKPDKFIEKFEKLVLPKHTGCKDERSAFYIGYIATGKADHKFLRRMRTESSGAVSESALRALIKYKDLYSNFDDLIVLFNDSKYQNVVDVLVNFYDKKDIMHMIGNPLSNKDYIRKKLMS
jgi:hypothetical protein